MLRFNFAEAKRSIFETLVKPDLVFLFLTLLIASGSVLYMERELRLRIKNTSEELSKLEREIERLRQIRQEEKRIREIKAKLESKLKIIKELNRRREVPKPLYFFLDRGNTSHIWLDEMTISKGEVNLTGNIWDVRELPPFLKKLESQLGKVLLKKVERVDYKNEELNFRSSFYHFELGVEQKYGAPK